MWNTELSQDQNLQALVFLSRASTALIQNPKLRSKLTEALNSDDVAGAMLAFELPSYSEMSVMDALHGRQALAFFQKNATFAGPHCTSVALETWLETERVCRETNVRLRTYLSGNGLAPAGVDAVLFAAQRKIAKVLGPRVPALRELRTTFGPGATICVKKKNACARTKLSASPQCSINMVGLVSDLFYSWPQYIEVHGVERDTGDPDYVIVDTTVEIADGKLGFVPKNAKTDRTVLVEPTLNGVVQGAYGRFIKDRLLGVGIDLSDQSRNKRLAREGSLTGELATLDLSSASDLISIELVKALLPVDWFIVLSECRTPVVELGDGSTITLEKFSSMGNGFTFPLQSLIFWALITASQDTLEEAKKCSVYGDDLIVPKQSVHFINSVFEFVGFRINLTKSFWDGPFRESCGGDYYSGINIRPIYAKDRISPKSLFVMHNYFVRTYNPEMAEAVLSLIREDLRLYGPDGYGDGHLLGEWRPRAHKRDQGWSGWLFDTFSEVGSKHKKLMIGDRILPAYSLYTGTRETWDGCRHEGASLSVPKTEEGVPVLNLPGTVTYQRVRIYTLTPQ